MYASPAELRSAVRRGEFRGVTSGQCAGYEQANILALPSAFADDFSQFCALNPAPLPVLAVGRGRAVPAALLHAGVSSDVATDVPGYVVHRVDAAGAATALATRDAASSST